MSMYAASSAFTKPSALRLIIPPLYEAWMVTFGPSLSIAGFGEPLVENDPQDAVMARMAAVVTRRADTLDSQSELYTNWGTSRAARKGPRETDRRKAAGREPTARFARRPRTLPL